MRRRGEAGRHWTQEWPGEAIAALDGYAGSWIDEPQQVMTVQFTGDLDAAEAADRNYTDALCVARAGARRAVSSIRSSSTRERHRVLWTIVHTGAKGEWIEGGMIAPDPARRAAIGGGSVQAWHLKSLLPPMPSAPTQLLFTGPQG